MKLIKPSFSIIEQQPGLEGVYKQIELGARLCYKSEDKITEDSYKRFIEMLDSKGHCYTGESEVLTENGWIQWRKYSGEKVAVINKDLTFKGFESPSRVIKTKYEGNFYNYPELGITVTEGHKMYGSFREKNSNGYKLFVCNAEYRDNNGRLKTLGERQFKSPKCCKRPAITDPYYELLGFWLGDGCFSDTHINKLVFHLKKSRKIQYLKSLCDSLGYVFEKKKSNKYTVTHDNINIDFSNNFYKNNEKYLEEIYTDTIKSYSIIQGLLNSDGSASKNKATMYFSTTSRALKNWIINNAPLCGYSISYTISTYNNSKVYNFRFHSKNYAINNDPRKKDKKVIITKESKDVYCVTVSTGLIIVRGTNYTTSICGNCSPFEHGTVYLKIPNSVVDAGLEFGTNWATLCLNPYTKYTSDGYYCYYSTNYRVILENDLQGVSEYLCEPTEYHEKRVTVKFVCDRGVSHEFVRHRVFSFCLSGDSVLYSMKQKKWTIRELYNWQQDPKRKGRLQLMHIRSVNENNNTIVANTIKKIFKTGEKEVFEVTTKSGRKLKATKDHKFYTKTGYIELGKLNIGDFIYANGKELLENKDWLTEEYINKNRTRKEIAEYIGCCESTLYKAFKKFNIVKAKNSYPNRQPGYGIEGMHSEEEKQRISIRMSGENNPKWKETKGESAAREYARKRKIGKCQLCGEEHSLEQHHWDKNPLNYDSNNLITVCTHCHKLIHHTGTIGLFLDEIVSIESKGIEEVYDIEMQNEHNFVANGLVVHNCQESQRYCNYSKDKYNNKVTFCIPCWLDLMEGEYMWEDQNPLLTAGLSVEEVGYDDSSNLWIKNEDGSFNECKRHYKDWQKTESFMQATQVAEKLYLELLNQGWKPQQAREVLPNATKTELMMTGFVSDWKKFFELRCQEAAHPSARELAIPLKEEFIKRGWLNE